MSSKSTGYVEKWMGDGALELAAMSGLSFKGKLCVLSGWKTKVIFIPFF